MRRAYLAAIAASAMLVAGCSPSAPDQARSAAKPATEARAADVAKPAEAKAAEAPRPAPTPWLANRPAEAAKPAVPSKPAEPATIALAQSGRMVIYNAELSLVVKDVGESVGAVTDTVIGSGGYVAGVENKEENGARVTIVRVKVPSERYGSILASLRGLAVEVPDEKATSQDVTEEYSDTQTQLAALEASHAQLREFMSRTGSIEEMLKVQEKLAQTKLQIDRLKGRSNFLERNSELATLAIQLRRADDYLARAFTTARQGLRKSESARAATLAAIGRAKSTEEEAQLRDRLAEQTLEINRLGARLGDVERKASLAGVTLPTISDELAGGQTSDDQLARAYLDARIRARQVAHERDELMRRLRDIPVVERGELQKRSQDLIVEYSQVQLRLKSIQDRATQIGMSLPALSPEEEAALSGVPIDDARPRGVVAAAVTAWNGSLGMLSGVLTVVVSVVVYLWWAIPLAIFAALAWRGRAAAGRRESAPAA